MTDKYVGPTSLAELWSKVKSWFVKKSGDTMTGDLAIKDTTIDRDGSNPSDIQYSKVLRFDDKDGERIGYFGAARETDGRVRLMLYAYNENDDIECNAHVNICIDKDGGGAVGIGHEAPESGLEVGYPAVFDTNVTTYGAAHIKDHGLQLDYQDLDTSYNATLPAQKDANIFVMDKNNLALAAFRGRQLASGEKRAVMEAHGYNSNGDSIWCNIICQVDKSGARSYSVSDAAAFRNAIAAVNKAGDTMTGALNIKSSGIDRDGSNPSSTVWGQYVNLQDKDGERIGAFGVARETDGRTRVGLWAYNEKSDGTESSASLSVFSAKDGTHSYSLSSPAAFRNALGASSGVFPASVGGTGSAYFDTNPPADVNGSTVSVANDRTTTIATMTITSPGKYILHAGFNFASNATGRRIAGLTFDDTVGVGARTQTDTRQAVNGYGTMISFVRVVNANSSSYKIRANVYQNSGGALNCNCYIFAFRLK